MLGWIITSTVTASVLAWYNTVGSNCTSRNNRLMLNSDMCLIKDITFNGSGGGGQPTCTHDSCADSPTVSVAQEFAGNNGQFLAEWSAALGKMLNKGYHTADLTVVGGDGTVEATDVVADVDEVAVPTVAPAGGAHLKLGSFGAILCATGGIGHAVYGFQALCCVVI